MYLTFFGQHSDADTRVTELDKRQAARHPILLSDQKNILGTDISMNEVLILLHAEVTGMALITFVGYHAPTLNEYVFSMCILCQWTYQVVHSPG